MRVFKSDETEVTAPYDVTSIEAPNATTLDASYCDALTSIEAPNATTLDASGCKSLTSIEAPNATTLDARSCPSLTSIEAPNGVVMIEPERRDKVEVKSITLDEYQAPGGPMEKLLTAGGATIKQILDRRAWDCHEWNNCPLHVAFGVEAVEELPKELQQEGARFLALFDNRFLRRPDHLVAAGAK